MMNILCKLGMHKWVRTSLKSRNSGWLECAFCGKCQ